MNAERVLCWLIRIMGGLAALALIAVVMPTAWIDAGSRATGVGPFVDTTLTQYLTRSVSLLYCLLGLLLLWIAQDVRRHLDFIIVMGWLTIGLGIGLTILDFAIGMPAAWSWAEGPPTVPVGIAFIWLARRVRSAPRDDRSR